MRRLHHILTACALLPAALRSAPPVAPVAFDWFQYSGADPALSAPLPAGHYRNPILTGFYPDPSICRAGDDYYLVNSTFAYFPGIPVFHSRDLVNWRQIGSVVTRPAQLDYDGLALNSGLYAPTIRYSRGKFYLLCTMIGAGGNFLMTATNPAGPWSDPTWLKFEGIDPSLFFDTDNRAWLVNNGAPAGRPLYPGHRAIWIQEFDPATDTLIGPRRVLLDAGIDPAKKPVWIEGPHLFKRHGWYYLCCAEGGTSLRHSQVILRSHSVTGPYEPWAGNPILTQRDLDGTAPGAVTCTGHADLVIGPDGRWWSTFLACRPFAGKYWTTGRETFLLPVTWTQDEWPVILPHGRRVPWLVPTPGGNDVAPNTLSGNFTWRDEFDESALGPSWLMLRAPHDTWWSLAQGQLRLTPRPDFLSGHGQPSFLAHRVQHARFTASTRLAVPPHPGVSAGLALLQGEDNFFYAGVRRTARGMELFLETRDRAATRTVETKFLPANIRELALRLTTDERTLRLDYAAQPGDWRIFVPAVDALAITVQAAGDGTHFTGAVVGPCVRLDP
jgi:alpha-N-arabinofuranosidase